MDPNATLLSWAMAVIAEDKYEANEHYENLRSWLDRGGFEPDWSNVPNNGFVRLPSRKQFFSYNTQTGMVDA